MNERAFIGLGLVGLAAMLASLAAETSPVLATPCRDAVVVEGALYCGEAAARATAQRCPGIVAAPGTVIDARCLPRHDPVLMRRLGVVVDLARADALALTSLPGVGPTLAGRIIAARPLADPAALLEVRGIGPKTLARIAPRLRWPPGSRSGPNPNPSPRGPPETAAN